MFYLSLIIPAMLLVLAFKNYNKYNKLADSGRVVEIIATKNRYDLYLCLTFLSVIALFVIHQFSVTEY